MKVEQLKTVLEPDHKPLVFPKTIISFTDTFDTNEKCLNYIASVKWGDEGWYCPRCGNKKFYFITTRRLMHCKNCSYEESFIANTMMRRTRKPLSYWFWAIYMLATQNTGLSAKELCKQLDLRCYGTAWTWLHKIRLAMANSERIQLQNYVEVDETNIQTGRGENCRKTGGEQALIICAVEVKNVKNGELVSNRIRLKVIPDESVNSLHSFILDNVAQGATVKTDGCRGYKGLKTYGYNHFIDVIGDPEEARKKFLRVHRIFNNLKAWLIGTHRFISIKHMQSYLNEFTFRFNRRTDPLKAFNDLLKIAVSMPARPYKEFVETE